jgi:hypothetical protein
MELGIFGIESLGVLYTGTEDADLQDGDWDFSENAGDGRIEGQALKLAPLFRPELLHPVILMWRTAASGCPDSGGPLFSTYSRNAV